MAHDNNGKRPYWEKDLQALLFLHNATAMMFGMTVLRTTEQACARALRRIFALLHAAGFKAGPNGLGSRQLDFLMLHWAANPRAQVIVASHGHKLAPLAKPLSRRYIEFQLSMLRRLARWTNKPGLVLPLDRYIEDLALGDRIVRADTPKRRLDAIVDYRDAIDTVERVDTLVALQLEMVLLFGLTRRQAVEFSPALSEIPAHALPREIDAGSCIALVRPKRGTAEIEVRYVQLETAEQRALFERAKQLSPYPGSALRRLGQNPAQAVARFTNVVRRRCGVSIKALKGAKPVTVRVFKRVSVIVRSRSASAGISVEFMDAVYLEIARRLGNQP